MVKIACREMRAPGPTAAQVPAVILQALVLQASERCRLRRRSPNELRRTRAKSATVNDKPSPNITTPSARGKSKLVMRELSTGYAALTSLDGTELRMR
jgi:hypothetical protein